MTRPDQSGENARQPGSPAAGGPPEGGPLPPERAGRPWDWAIDPAPPEGPSREPVPDPYAGRTVDEIPDPIPPGVGAPPRSSPEPSAGRTAEPPDVGPPPRSGAEPSTGRTAEPPAWSTPDTPARTPPLSGYAYRQSHPGPATGPTAGGPAVTGPAPSGPGVGGPAGPGQTPGGPVPGGPGVGPQPGGPAWQAPGFGRPADRRWWVVLGIVAALLSCCCVATAVIALAWGPDFYTGLRERDPPVVGLNQPVRDGDLEFQVSHLRCGLAEVGDPLVSQLAVGQFCVVGLAVRNLGTRPAVFHDNLQVAYGPAGQRFGVDSTAGLLANADQQAFLSEINPGNRVTGAIVYDIPPDSRIVRVRLRGSATSSGVEVRTR